MFNVIPEPKEVSITNSEIAFALSGKVGMPDAPEFANEFKAFVKKALGVDLLDDANCESTIELALDDSVNSNEGYKIACGNSKIIISAKNNCGLYYGLQTLKQILLSEKGKLPEFEIFDEPKYAYRAFLLDSGRYFQTVDEIKRLIDVMSFHKMNCFHWHLTEDQGWRIEIKKYPELTKKGQRRSHTNFGIKPEEGFYTQDEIREIVKYCHDRFMKVIPEIDVPGHVVSAIACYPYLSCFDRKLNVATHWGVKHDVLCCGKDTTYDFVFGVLDEVIDLFPDKYIHIGGDEVVKMRWERCEHCQALMKKEGLKNEDELQQFFMNKVNAYVKSKGYTSIMWNYDKIESAEILDTDIIWQSCSLKDIEGLIAQQYQSGRTIINSDTKPYYLDFPHGWNSLKQVYEHNPEFNGGEIWGVEGAIWTEYIPNMRSIERHSFPRTAGICENAWGDSKNKNYDEFMKKIPSYFEFLDVYDVKYSPLSISNPSKLLGKIQSTWFSRRIFHWQGLHNLIDDAIVNSKHKKL